MGVVGGLGYLDSLGVVTGLDTGGNSILPRSGWHGIDKVQQKILFNAKGDVCLTDFGLSVVTHDGTSPWGIARKARGRSPICVAPETLREGKSSKEADMYCFSLAAIGVRFSGIGPYPADSWFRSDI